MRGRALAVYRVVDLSGSRLTALNSLAKTVSPGGRAQTDKRQTDKRRIS